MVLKTQRALQEQKENSVIAGQGQEILRLQEQIRLLRSKIEQVEKERDNIQRDVNSYHLLQILAQSGLLRSVRISEQGLLPLIQSLLRAEFGEDFVPKDAPQPRKVPGKRPPSSKN